MKEYRFQKIYFMKTYIQYPSLIYNQIMLGMLDKYRIKNIKFTNKILMYVNPTIKTKFMEMKV